MLFVGIPLVVLFGSLGQAESTTLAVATGVIGYAGRMGRGGCVGIHGGVGGVAPPPPPPVHQPRVRSV